MSRDLGAIIEDRVTHRGQTLYWLMNLTVPVFLFVDSYIAQASLKFAVILLPFESWVTGISHHALFYRYSIFPPLVSLTL